MMALGKLFVLLALLSLSVANNIEYDGTANIELFHCFDGDSMQPASFSERGNISITSIRLGEALVNQKPLSVEEQKKLRDLAVANQYYQVKAVVNEQDTYVSYVKACMLAEAELTDIVTITLDYSGNVVSTVALVASTSTCEGATVFVGDGKLRKFRTSVHVRHTNNGPIPDTASYIQKLDREREAQDRGEVKDNRSFLAKYWMYIVPVVIIMVLSSVTNQEAPNNGGR